MPRLTPEEKLERLKKAQAETLAAIRSEAGKIGAKNRKMDTRRKILIGAAMLERAARSNGYSKAVTDIIKDLPERDRLLFEGWKVPAPSAPPGAFGDKSQAKAQTPPASAPRPKVDQSS